MGRLLQRYFEICLLRAGPQDLPASPLLLWLSLFAYFAVGLGMSLQNLSFGQAVLLVSIDVGLLGTLLFALLWSRDLLVRFPQTLTALLGTGAILELIVVPILSWQQAGLGGDTIDPALVTSSLLLWMWLLWDLLVIGHILRHTLSTRLMIGVLLGLVYLFVSYSVTRLLFFSGGKLMRVHILGICGTFMGGLALLARELGFEVSGSDHNVYPPMSTQLEASGIRLHEGYGPEPLEPAPDLVVIGNALSRGNPAVEHVLNRGLAYTSGPEFLARHVLQGRWVLGVAGTHGKTTTSSMLAWILEHARLDPGYLIGGAPLNFPGSARLGSTPFFVVEADEYDSAFFDKRSKFVHYGPRTLIMNNLEYDHADIFPDVAAIRRQFHHLVRTVPGEGLIVLPAHDAELDEVLRSGCWTPTERFRTDAAGADGDWWARLSDTSGEFAVCHGAHEIGTVRWTQSGRHNVANALAAIVAARHAGVPPTEAIAALAEFRGVKRRLEKRATVRGIGVYDDFAHHPTAIATTLEGFRHGVGSERIIAVLELRSNTMKMGVHKERLAPALAAADEVLLYQPPDLGWSLQEVADAVGARCRVFDQVQSIIDHLCRHARSGDHILIMSNGGFERIHDRLIEALRHVR